MLSYRYQNFLVFGLFLVLTLAMTFPLVLHLGTSVRDRGDPLLNTWILAWNNKQMAEFKLAGWFDANIYYPNRNTLALSEHLFPQALLSLPVNLLTGNPILAYNLALILAFATSGFGMYLLARRLSGHLLGSIAAGMIFAFSPFMFAHLPQIQVISAAGIPLAFLFLIRTFDQGRWRDLLLFTLCYILQSLANGYYALFLTVLAGLFILFMTLAGQKWRLGRFWLQMVVFALLAILALGPFLSHYAQVKRTLGLARGIGASARLTSFLTTPPQNVLYGRFRQAYRQPENELFPGVVAFILAGAGGAMVLRLKKKSLPEERSASRRWLRLCLWVLTGGLVVQTVFLFLTVVQGSFELTLSAGLNIHARSLWKPLLLWVVLAGLYVLLKKVFKAGPLWLSAMKDPVWWGLATVFLAALLMTFGRNGPFVLLSKYVPGFEGLRAPTRCHIFVMFGLACFAAFGLRTLGQFLAGRMGRVLAFLALILIAAEYLSVPMPLVSVPVKRHIPPVYQWLAAQKGEDFALVEFPFPREGQGVGMIECSRIYFSTYHWKHLVNGYSGYIPPLYNELRRRWQGGCSLLQNIDDLKTLGVRYMVYHYPMFEPGEFSPIRAELASLPDRAAFVGQFDEDFVYEVIGWREGRKRLGQIIPLRRIQPTAWQVRASVNDQSASLAIDGRKDTRWDTAGPQQPGQFFEVDLGRTLRLARLSLVLGSSALDFPRGYRVEISLDGSSWTEAARQDQTLMDIRAFLRPKDLALDIPLSNLPARFIRIINTGEDRVLYWSIHELEVYSSR